jgi:hypothetical protein
MVVFVLFDQGAVWETHHTPPSSAIRPRIMAKA